MNNIDPVAPVANPLVSISIITYNHEKYIAEAIDSVLMQEVNFSYEIIIGDDFSTDNTAEILKKYQQKYPDRIQLILHPRDYDNIPGRINNITNLYACRGKYIAMLDGDDVWLNNNKLQTQIEFLENNTDYTLTFHHAILSYPNGDRIPYKTVKPFLEGNQLEFAHADIVKDWFAQTSSLVFRNHLIGEFPEWFWEVYSADYAIQLLLSKQGKVRYFPELDVKRRFHTKSFTAVNQGKIATVKLRINEYYVFHKHFKPFKSYRAYTLARTYFYWSRLAIESGSLKEAGLYLGKTVKYTLIATIYPQTRQKKKTEGRNIFLR